MLMFLKNWRRTPVLLIFASLAAMSHLAAAQGDDAVHSSARYSRASICGDYGVVATYGANVARALATESFDGGGKLTGAAIVNQPGPNSTRTLIRIELAGTYAVNTDGTGTMSLAVTLPGGITANVTEDFVITKVKTIDGKVIAAEIQDAQETPSAVIDDTSLVTHTYTLRTVPRACSMR
jgi:hypothetical protein